MTGYIYDDKIYRINRSSGKLEIGLVLENWESNEDDSTSSMKQGEVRVAWYPSGDEETVPEKKLRLLDRNLAAGDIASGGKPRQLGICRCVQISATVQVVGTNKVLANVSTNELRPLERMCVGQRVLCNDWLGVVEDVREEVTLRSALDDSRGTLEANRAADLHDVHLERNKMTEFRALSFYPGQQLWGPTKYFKNVRWSELKDATRDLLNCRGKNLRVHVEDYRTVSLAVRLPNCAKMSPNAQSPIVVNYKDIPDIKPINAPGMFAIGTRYYYVVKKSDVFTTLIDWKGLLIDAYDSEVASCVDAVGDGQNLSTDLSQHSDVTSVSSEEDWTDTVGTQTDNPEVTEKPSREAVIRISYSSSHEDSNAPSKDKKVRLPLSLFSEPDLNDSESVVVELLQTSTLAEIIWQDGTSGWYKSTDLIILEQLETQEFFPGSYVLPTGCEDVAPNLYGVVEKVNYEDRTSVVQWYKLQPGDNPSTEQDKKEELSIYDLKEHQYNDIKLGSWVIYLPNSGNDDALSKCGWVVDLLPTGKIKINLANKEEVTCYPHEVCLESEDDDDDEEDEEETSWETQSDGSEQEKMENQSKLTLEKADDIALSIIDLLKALDENFQGDMDEPTLLGHIFEMSRLKEIVTYLNEDGRKKLASSLMDPTILPNIRHLFKDIFELCNLTKKEAVKKKLNQFYSQIHTLASDRSQTTSQGPENKVSASSSAETLPTTEVATPNPEEAVAKVTVLDRVPETHSYIASVTTATKPVDFARRIKHELAILKNSLPDGIFVRNFADRIDLFSVLIKGSKGTPYEDGIFAFDMHLPPNYPNLPPQVNYISYCSDRLNPNLYEQGRVCVSLLGTWDGKGSEVWNPAKSNLLQLLVSIQGLILVAEPYYNEAGYDKQMGTSKGKENSRIYNEVVVLNLLQSMINMAKNPHQVFVQEIKDHLVECGPRLVTRLEGWLQSSSEETCEGPSKPEFHLFPMSKGFCISLKSQLNKFKETLKELTPQKVD